MSIYLRVYLLDK